jgi:hypothetical protein
MARNTRVDAVRPGEYKPAGENADASGARISGRKHSFLNVRAGFKHGEGW